MINKIKFKNIGYMPEKANKEPTYIERWSKKAEFYSYRDYCLNSYYQDINDSLRLGLPVSNPNSAVIIKDMDNLFDTMPEQYCVKAPELVFRGIQVENLPQELLDIITLKNPANNTFTDKGFVSCSRDKRIAKEFACSAGTHGIFLDIILPTGSKRIDSSSLPYSIKSLFSSEQEVTLPRNSQFRVDSYNPKTGRAKLTYLGQKLPLDPVSVMPKEHLHDELDILAMLNKTKINNEEKNKKN
ncbi:hypothetical protein II906_10915 [bacterium]|nr:hypothetical protein [bacterium]